MHQAHYLVSNTHKLSFATFLPFPLILDTHYLIEILKVFALIMCHRHFDIYKKVTNYNNDPVAN